MKTLQCPKCGSEDVAEVVYGLIPALSEDLKRNLSEGKIVLGGCCVDSYGRWQCNRCEYRWGKVRI